MWARIISVLFHPVLVPTLGTILFTFIHIQLHMRYARQGFWLRIALVVFLFTAVMPTLTVFWLRKAGKVPSMHLPSSGDRKLPLLISAFSFLAVYYFMDRAGISRVLVHMLLGGTLAMCLAYFLNFFIKLSLHMLAWSALAGQIAAFGYHGLIHPSLWLGLVIMATGVVASARLKLNAHTPAEILTGCLLGFGTQAIWITLVS